MISYSVVVCLPPSFCTLSHPPAPRFPVPAPEDHQAAFRLSCLVKYHDARLSGLDHIPAIREVARLLRLAGHPWAYFDIVGREINQALGRRPGRPLRSKS